MLLTIDYLILNFEGFMRENRQPSFYDGVRISSTAETLNNPFSTVKHEYGNKTFADVYDLFYHGEKIAIVNANPRSNVINERLIQMQFENHLFYTNDLRGLGNLVNAIVDYFDMSLKGINRLDIAFDRSDYCDAYVSLYLDLIEGKKKIKGREKNVSAYMVTKNGSTEFQGFQIGKRTSSRMLRIYNKTKALLDPKNPKNYINEYFEKNNLTNSISNPVWRYEYQLNATFFTYLRERGEIITTQIFDVDALLNLIQKAEKNHFEIVYDTGKTETNKEESFVLNDWELVRTELKAQSNFFAERLKKPFEPSITVQKRLVKGLFRQYYTTAEIVYCNALCQVVKEFDLMDWFFEKYPQYTIEFMAKEKIAGLYDEERFLLRYHLLLKKEAEHETTY